MTDIAKNKKETPKFTDGQLDEMAKVAGKELNEQDKVKIRIPIDPLNKTDLIVPVCINGYVWQIERGKTVSVPEAVSEILGEAGYI